MGILGRGSQENGRTNKDQVLDFNALPSAKRLPSFKQRFLFVFFFPLGENKKKLKIKAQEFNRKQLKTSDKKKQTPKQELSLSGGFP